MSITERTDRVKNADDDDDVAAAPPAAEDVPEVEAVPAEVEDATEPPPPKDAGALVSTRKLPQLPLFRIFPPPLAETTLPVSLGEATLLDFRGTINFLRRSSDCCRTAVSNRCPSAGDALPDRAESGPCVPVPPLLLLLPLVLSTVRLRAKKLLLSYRSGSLSLSFSSSSFSVSSSKSCRLGSFRFVIVDDSGDLIGVRAALGSLGSTPMGPATSLILFGEFSL